MNRKKIIIYIITISVFIIFFFFYIWSMFLTTEKLNSQRIEERIKLSETQLQKNIHYLYKDLSLLINKYNINKSTSFEQTLEAIQKIESGDTYFYLAKDDGTSYTSDGEKNLWKIDSSALKWAFENEYSAISIPHTNGETPSVGIITSISDEALYYLVMVIPADLFLEAMSSDITISTKNMVLFDEWGNIICCYKGAPEDQALYSSITAGASAYCMDKLNNAFHKISGTDQHSFYLSLAQPRGWFIGTNTLAGEANSIFGMHSPSILILLGLILILAAIVTLDIINDKDKKVELNQLSNVDRLTNLNNSLGMQHAFDRFQETHNMSLYGFVCTDIVAFSRVNTMFGHSVGDSLLRIIADVIRNNAECGTRVNADHFTFLLKAGDDMITQFEQRLKDAVDIQLGSEYNQIITFKFGIYPITTQKVVFRDVYEGALWALKDAKKIPVQNNVIYDNDLRLNMELQKDIEVNMMHALSKDEFLVYIQPQFSMPSERCTRGETLIRWNSEYMGFLPPDKFIPIFESNGFIVETDFYMLTSALEFLSERIKSGKPPITLAVNQSKVTIAFPNYFERLKASIEQYSVPLSYIELEITESTLENSWEIIVPLIHNVKKLGFSIAMDDFGSGFSSLNTLRILPIDILKIDKAFLQESDSSSRSRSIIKNVVNMAKELNIQVVCEGVETETQLAFLKSINCDIVQGFYYSKPLPIDEFIQAYLD